MPLIKREAEGHFQYPYLSVSYGQHYSGYIFSWDNHHMTLRCAVGGEPEQMRYFVDNMLSFQTSNGYIPCVISAVEGCNGSISDFHAQPFLAQNAVIYSTLTSDTAWMKKVFPKLKSYLSYWLAKHAAPFGIAVYLYVCWHRLGGDANYQPPTPWS